MNAFNKEEKKLEMTSQLRKNPDFDLEQVEEEMAANGMFLSTSEKIFLLESKKSRIKKRLASSVSDQRKYSFFNL